MRRRADGNGGATAIEDLQHPADLTRLNIPTAEMQSYVAADEAAPKPMLYPRNPDLDPQLVWRGKDDLDRAPLQVDTVPVYIQEKILPEALIIGICGGFPRDVRRRRTCSAGSTGFPIPR